MTLTSVISTANEDLHYFYIKKVWYTGVQLNIQIWQGRAAIDLSARW